MSRHRPPPWWVRHRLATVVTAGAAVVALVVATAATLGYRPAVDLQPPMPIIAQPTGHASGTKPWPTAVIPTIGASGAWNPDAGLPTSTPPATRAPTRCSRCGDRTPATTAPTTTEAPPPPDRPPTTEAAAADPPPAVAAELLTLVNRDRATAGCPPVALHPSLVQQSQAHSDAQAADDTMEHSGGVTGFDTWGENVADGFDTAAQVHDGWMSSPPHRANILNCAFTVMGAADADSPTGVRYWTEQLAA